MAEAPRQSNSEVQLSFDALYEEGAATFRHYSSCSLTIRLSVIIQGLTIMSASGYLFLQGQFSYSFAAAVFGLYFTVVLFAVYWAYDTACGVFQKNLSDLEGVWSEAVSAAEVATPFSAFGAVRESRYRSFLVRALTLYGAFTSVGLGFLVFALVSGLAWLRL